MCIPAFRSSADVQADGSAFMCNSAYMDSLQAQQRAIVTSLLRATGLDASGLARAAGLSASTLTRFLNSSDHKHALSARTLSALASVAQQYGVTSPSAGFSEDADQPLFRPPPIEWDRLPEVIAALDAELRARDIAIGARRLARHAQDALVLASGMASRAPLEERIRHAIEGKAADLARKVD